MAAPHPLTASAYNQLGLALCMQAKYGEAHNAYRRALGIRPDLAEAHCNLGNMFQEQGRLPEALACYELGIAHETQVAITRWNRSLSLLQSGNFSEGWKEYEWRWKRKQTPPRPFRQPRWDGGVQPGRTLLIYMEQGLGDILQFIRFAAAARERVGRVVVECPGFVLPLLRGCAGVDEVVAEGVLGAGADASGSVRFDLQIPVMSLPGVLGTTLETLPGRVPYLVVEEDRVTRWREEVQRSDTWRATPPAPPCQGGEKDVREPGGSRSALHASGATHHESRSAFDASRLKYEGAAPTLDDSAPLGASRLNDPASRVTNEDAAPTLYDSAPLGASRLTDPALRSANDSAPSTLDDSAPLSASRLNDPASRVTNEDAAPTRYDSAPLRASWLNDPADADGSLFSFRVGIVWQGNPNHRLDRYRSIPLAQFGVLAQIPGVRLISLQKGPAAAQIDELRGKFQVEKPPIVEEMTAEALLDTAALMKNLDLVISADTGTAHLAGGLAVPVWVPLSAIGEWRWLLHRDDSPWYPTMRLFRQKKLGRWKPVFRRMAKELSRSFCPSR